MTKKKSVTHYAISVHGQPNNNLSSAPFRIDWDNCTNASSTNATTKPKGSAKSYYTKSKTKVKRPWTLSAHNFNLNLPDCAYINKITFTVRMKISDEINVKAPYARFNIYKGTNSVTTYREDDTGWDDGYWYYNPNKKLKNTWSDFKYIITGDNIRKRGYPISSINDIIMGIDLRFYAATSQSSSNKVSIDYVTCTVDYELPDHVITFDTVTSEDNPRIITSGEEYDVNIVYQNRSNAYCCNGTSREISVSLPANCVVRDVLNGNYDTDTNVWTVNCTANTTSKLGLTLKNYGVGEDKLNLKNADVGDYDYWIYSVPVLNDVGDVVPYPDKIMQEGVLSCIHYRAIVNAADGDVVFTVNVDTVNPTGPVLSWSLEDDYNIEGVSIDTENTNDSQIKFNVPEGEVTELRFKSCFIPTFNGDTLCSVQLDDDTPVTAPYTCLEAPNFVIRNNTTSEPDDRTIMEFQLNSSELIFNNHRLATSTEIEAYVIDCGVANYDGNMVTDECSLTASTWEKLNYIGCVPLKYGHYDPKSTYENKLIDESYKNKTYMGKDGVIDEEITLNFKTAPADVTTLQGLVKLDKPTPINANWRCFEGDALNHRGWVVLSKIEAEKTNPLYYDVSADVKYITHDIHTKFQIYKGLAVNNVNMPDMVTETFEVGDNLSQCLNFLNIDTDGGFIYDDEGEDGAKNIFSLDEGQHLSITTRNTLSNVSNIRFDWYSNRINELRENKLERIFYLRDTNGNPIFSYEYTDFSFSEDYVSCTVILRYLNNDGAWEVITFENIDLRTELEADPIVDDNDEVTIYDVDDEGNDEEDYSDFLDENGEEVIWIGNDTSLTADDITYTGYDILTYLDHLGYDYLEPVLNEPLQVLNQAEDDETDAYEEGYIAPSFNTEEYDLTLIYGSSLLLELNNTSLKVTDSGFSGREVYQEIQLVTGQYYFDTLWVNNNADGTTEDIISYIDMGLDETVLNTQYSELYGDLIVSPFPIPKKKVVFTRESQEGTIYYLTGEEPFKYMLEPFYQYYCGTDLVTREGISIFDLNNSYTYFYIQNGLVRLGFNKYNGSLYLAKYDINSKEYVTTTYLHMSEDTKFSLASDSDDDKITIKAGTDTYFTIWRGHPYIHVENKTDTIYFDSNFNYCYGDSVEGINYEYPLIHAFMNTDNLLPSCIGSKSLDYDCISINDDEPIGTNHEIELTAPSTVTALDDVTLSVTLTPNTSNGEVHYLINGVDVGTATSPFSYVSDDFKEDGKVYTVQAVYTGDDTNNVAISDVINVIAEAPEPPANSYADNGTPEAETITGKYKLSIIHAPAKFTYRDYDLDDNQQVILQLTRGKTAMPNMIVEIQRPDGRTTSHHTDSNGKVYIPNNSSEYIPGKYQWGGRFYDEIDEDMDKQVLSAALKWISIEKATPTFTHNSSTGKVNKGNYLHIKLNGINSQAGISNIGLTGKKITYTINGGSKKTKTTNDKGKIYIPCNTKGTKKIKVYFAGSTRYKAITKTFTIKVV